MIKRQEIQPIGMRQDNLIGTNQSSKYAHEIKNLRFNTTGDYTTASWVTEQGTLYKPFNVVGDTDFPRDSTNCKLRNLLPIGQAVINDVWILFTTSIDETLYGPSFRDFIFKLWFTDDTLNIQLLYRGNLNFSKEHPLETITYYENERIQKVYWTDGINQPRMINVGIDGVRHLANHNDQFDFVKKVELNETVTITKHRGGAGQFPPGTVKYALTYYNKYGQESNIIWTSTLLYPMRGERACSPDELSGDEFEIRVTGITENTYNDWERIRLYSIVRSVDDSTPVVRIVDDRPLVQSIVGGRLIIEDVVFIDSNTTGEIIDPTVLNYVGGRDITAETFDQKDNTLFLGNLHLKRKSLKSVLEGVNLNENSCTFELTGTIHKDVTIAELHTRTSGSTSYQTLEGLYPWLNELNDCKNPKIFKRGEWYRIGIQCQDELGNWSDIVFLKDVFNDKTPQTGRNQSYGRFPVVKYAMPQLMVTTLKNAGYKKVRLACCFPTNNDRSVLAQGVLCPVTVQQKWQANNAPYFISSWFYRFKDIPKHGGGANNNDCWLHADGFPEVQTMEVYVDRVPDTGDYGEPKMPNHSRFREDYWTFTFHSPEIEFDESIRTLDWSNIKVRLVGKVYQEACATKLYVDYLKQAVDYAGKKGYGFKDNGQVMAYNYPQHYSFEDTYQDKYGYWHDIDVYNTCVTNKNEADADKVIQDYPITYDYRIYPFQRKHLGNYMGDLTFDIYKNNASDPSFTAVDSSIINSKVWSTLRVAVNNEYFSTYNAGLSDLNFLSSCRIFDSNEVIPVQLKTDSRIYFGNVDSVCPIDQDTTVTSTIFEYQGICNRSHYNGSNGHWVPGFNVTDTTASKQSYQRRTQLTKFTGAYSIIPKYLYNNYNSRYTASRDRRNYITKFGPPAGHFIGVSSDAVPIRYKSTPHCIIETDMMNHISGTAIPMNNGAFIAELYRDDITADQRFGGESEVAKLSNVYIPCSKSYNLDVLTANLNTLIHDEGDTYYMRYDNLKTYPFAVDDVNQIVEIFSFMCETRVNLDGRYDKNRGLTDNTNISNTNFNYINKSYTQTDNFFTYRLLDTLSTQLDDFSNQITWTKTKVAGELVDTWTNLTLASVADADGTLGEITKILNVNDNLILFQDHGIAHIGYNEKTALSTSNGVPLEIANSGKFTGFNYSTKTVGCQNKWSISNTKNGCWFIDDSRRELNAISEGLQPLSTINGFDAFMIDNLREAPEKWNPSQFLTGSEEKSNFVSYYDKLTKDVYYINQDYCLTWNEVTKTFTSFYDYNSIPYVASVGQHCMMTNLDAENNCGFYAARESNKYSLFFDVSKPYWITLLADGGEAFVTDKVFNNVEYRGDLFDEHSPVIVDADNFNPPNTNLINAINMPLFTDIAAYNGYQAYKEFKIDGRYNLSNNPTAYREYPWKAERKFNIWRVIVPRATYTQPDGSLATGRDRIRNPFCYIKLVNNEPARDIPVFRPRGVDSHRAIFHDFAVYYDMK